MQAFITSKSKWKLLCSVLVAVVVMENVEELSDEFSDEDFVPEEVLALANEASIECIPPKSKKTYDRAYRMFQDWKQKKKCRSNNETTILGYMGDYSKNVKPSTLWAHHAMLKATLKFYDGVDISNYNSVATFMKAKNKGYKPKKSKTLTPENLKNFMELAPNDVYLATKVSE